MFSTYICIPVIIPSRLIVHTCTFHYQIRKMLEYGLKGRHQNSLLLTTDFSQKLTQLSEGVSDLCRHFTIQTFCDLSHTYHKQVTNVSPECFCHPTMGNFDVSPKTLLKQHPSLCCSEPSTGFILPYF